MKKIVIAAALMASGLLASTHVFAEEGDPSPPSPPGPILLPQAVSRTGSFFLDPSGNLVQGQIQQSVWWTFGGGSGDPYTGQLLQLGDSSSSTQLQIVKGPIASAFASSTQSSAYGRSQAGTQLSYLVTLTASDAASAQYIEGLLGTSGAIANVSGLFKLSGSGYGYSAAVASTGGIDGLDPSLAPIKYLSCGSYGEVTAPGTAGCGTSGFNLPVNFVSGDHFADGAPMTFYSVISLDAETNAGTAGCCSGGTGGTASAFVDPKITLAAGIHATLTLGAAGDIGNESPVPEPGQWALMLAGLGVLGSLAWRRRLTARIN